ncbi:hypothetical protein [Actinokineospora iranica]|uniref:Uncharacterized protein n=1 Tax=Actinokineospora iranica TaxID=1271860 RepID=A0A1G6KPN3_9PSEU|nr:hypothetical protein [Actinokineospora iranica]SDC32306.1 hypothetical protein SAMN05216174_1011000 [Actinokineospora iranica]
MLDLVSPLPVEVAGVRKEISRVYTAVDEPGRVIRAGTLGA